MRVHAVAHPPVGVPRTGVTGTRAIRFIVDRFLLLPIGAAVALMWANTAAVSYFTFAHALSFFVNQVAMAFFLALIAQEVLEAVMPGGALHNWRRWSMPLVAAAGGIAGAAAVYLAFVQLKYELVLMQAWPVACAIDIAAGYYVLKMILPRSGALPFLLVLAIATDAFGLIVVGLRPAAVGLHAGGVALFLGAVGLAALLRHWRVRAFWPYLVLCGVLSWWGLYVAGIHPALALMPIVPFLPHEPRKLDLFSDPPDDDAVHHYEHEWNGLVQVVLFLFGLVNAGVLLSGYDTGTWAVLAAALVGRPLGILAAIALALALGLHLPRRIGWRQLTVIALATSSGFTFALFFATSVVPMGPVLAQIKIGALSTVAGALLAVGTAWLLGVGSARTHRNP